MTALRRAGDVAAVTTAAVIAVAIGATAGTLAVWLIATLRP